MIILILAIIFLIMLCGLMIYPLMHIISILDIPHYLLTTYDYLNWFFICVLITFIIVDVIILIDEIEYGDFKIW